MGIGLFYFLCRVCCSCSAIILALYSHMQSSIDSDCGIWMAMRLMRGTYGASIVDSENSFKKYIINYYLVATNIASHFLM